MLDISTTPADDSAHGRHRRLQAGRSGSRTVLLVVGALCTLLSATLFLVFGYGWYNFRQLNNGTHHFALHNLAGGADQHVDETTGSVQGKTQNILLVGIDSRADLSRAEQIKLHVGSDQSISADSIMILHVPADGSKATIISIPRDSFVDIPQGWAKNKINASYADAWGHATGTEREKEAAGSDLLIATVKKLTGLPIDHYVQVSFSGFYTIAKAIGKIPVNLCESVDDTYQHNQETQQGGGSGFKMPAGHHDLNAVQALEFVRQRHNLHGGDLARVERQRYFLTAAFDRIASLGTLGNPIKVRNLIKAINGAFTIDNGFSPLALAEQMADLSGNNITGHTIPVEGEGMTDIVGSQQDVLFVDPAKVQAKVAQWISGTKSGSSSSKPAKHHSSKPKGCIY